MRNILCLLLIALSIPAAVAATTGADSVIAVGVAPPPGKIVTSTSPGDTISNESYLAEHTITLDQYMQFVPGFFVTRMGPIGAHAALSRHGIGGSRGILYLGRTVVNDPQNGQPHFSMFPTTTIDRLILGRRALRFVADQSNIEGAFRVVEPLPPDDRPSVFVEVSKGDRNLRQNRIRFSSKRGKIGLDAAYDEMKNNGFSYDARGVVKGTDYGSNNARTISFDVRGDLGDGDTYRASFRRFKSSFQGDSVSVTTQSFVDGFIAVMSATTNGIEAEAYVRNYNTHADDPDGTSPIDSLSNNQTTGVVLTAPVVWWGHRLEFGATYDDIVADMNVNGATATPQLRRGSLGIVGHSPLAGGLAAHYTANVTQYFSVTRGWGGRFALARRLGRSHIGAVEVRRSFRMPNLGELYNPAHPATTGSTIVSGNVYVDPEAAFEVSGWLRTRAGSVDNEIRANFIRVRNPILPFTTVIDSTTYTIPDNGAAEDATILMDRLSMLGTLSGWSLAFEGAAEVTLGDRERFFAASPEWKVNAAFTIGRKFFRDTSGLALTTEYQYSSSRALAGGPELDPYQVWNFVLNGTLLEANVYLMLLNAFNEQYETMWPFLMTPRTLLYGITLELFD